jgi:hypothetical protein
LSPWPEALYVLTRLESRTISGPDNPALTITADPNNRITIVGKEQRDFSMQYCGLGGGGSEADARQRLGEGDITLDGSAVSLNNPSLPGRMTGGSLYLEAPANALTVTHATYSSVDVRNMRGPVRVAASHARATIVNTTGQVDAEALHIDFAGARGMVRLISEGDIRLALPAKFDGTLSAEARESVQMLVPPEFQTPFRVTVNHAEDFVCRIDLCSKVQMRTQGEKNDGQRFIFTYSGDGSAPPERFSLYSTPVWISGNRATSKVVVDNISNVTVKIIETGPAPGQ